MNIRVEASLNDIIHIKTKAIKTPYVSRPAEDFWAIKLAWRELPGLAASEHYRVLRLGNSSSTELIRISDIESINGKSTAPAKTEFEVTGSTGKKYIVNTKGGKYTCTCPGYIYRHYCKHIEEIKLKTI